MSGRIIDLAFLSLWRAANVLLTLEMGVIRGLQRLWNVTEQKKLTSPLLLRKLTKSSVKPAKFWRVKKKRRNCSQVLEKTRKNCENCIWQHVCILFQRHFVVPWTYRLLRTSLRKIRMIFGSVLPYWSYSLHPLQAGYSAAPRCGYTLHFSLYSVKPTYWLQKASAQTAKRF